MHSFVLTLNTDSFDTNNLNTVQQIIHDKFQMQSFITLFPADYFWEEEFKLTDTAVFCLEILPLGTCTYKCNVWLKFQLL